MAIDSVRLILIVLWISGGTVIVQGRATSLLPNSNSEPTTSIADHTTTTQYSESSSTTPRDNENSSTSPASTMETTVWEESTNAYSRSSGTINPTNVSNHSVSSSQQMTTLMTPTTPKFPPDPTQPSTTVGSVRGNENEPMEPSTVSNVAGTGKTSVSTPRNFAAGKSCIPDQANDSNCTQKCSSNSDVGSTQSPAVWEVSKHPANISEPVQASKARNSGINSTVYVQKQKLPSSSRTSLFRNALLELWSYVLLVCGIAIVVLLAKVFLFLGDVSSKMRNFRYRIHFLGCSRWCRRCFAGKGSDSVPLVVYRVGSGGMTEDLQILTDESSLEV